MRLGRGEAAAWAARRAALAALAATLAAAAGCGGSGADKAGGQSAARPLRLTLANLDSDPTNFDSPDFVAAAKRLSAGSIQIDTAHGWRSKDSPDHAERGTIQDVRRGRVDLAVVAARAWDLMGVKSFHALLAPFLVDSLELEQRVLEGPLAARMLAGVGPLHLVGLAIVPGSLRYPLGVTRALAGPEDYAGATIGIRPSGIEQATFEALGARARIYPAGSLSRLDGADLDLSTIATNHYEQQARALTSNVAFWPRALVVVMNRKAFEALTSEQQDVLLRAGRAAVAPHLADLRSDPQGWLINVCPRSRLRLVAASTADLAALRRAVQPVYDRLRRDPLTRELIARIRRLRRGGPPTDRVRCRRVTREAPPLAGPFDGRWQETLTRERLLAQGASKPLADQLRGRWVAEFEKGRFELHDRDTGAHARGTFVVHDTVVKLVFAGGVGLEPGKTREAQWSIYRNRLSFRAIRGKPSTIASSAPGSGAASGTRLRNAPPATSGRALIVAG